MLFEEFKLIFNILDTLNINREKYINLDIQINI